MVGRTVPAADPLPKLVGVRMEQMAFTFPGGRPPDAGRGSALVGVVGSGNLEVLIEAKPLGGAVRVAINTSAVGFGEVWQAVLEGFSARHRLGDVMISINDMGATPAVVSLRLDQAVRELLEGAPDFPRASFFEANARQRIAGIVDEGSFREFLPPEERVTSPHLTQLDTPVAFDDGVVVGEATVHGSRILLAAQEGAYMGGAVGEVHGAKLAGLLARAVDERPAALVLLLDSGGVRLHEANAGLIAVSEVIRAVLSARAAGVRVLAVIGGRVGCFGGMGIAARCCDVVIMSEEGRLGLSGPEVIETALGVEEFDSRDRALVWRTMGGKHRYLLGDCDQLTDDTPAAIRAAIHAACRAEAGLTVEELEREHAMLVARLRDFGELGDALEIWSALGIPDPESLPGLDVEPFQAMARDTRVVRNQEG
jgi:malonate decarboxylase beta subunit